jgi:hypothetical protein
MPADFGDITSYHREEAARHHALAKAARDRGCLAEADYQAGLAARWEEVALQQVTTMRKTPVRRIAKPRQIFPASKTPPKPVSVVSWSALVRGLQYIAEVLSPTMDKPETPLHIVPPR